MIRTVGELIEELKKFPPDANVTGYVLDSEDGGESISGIDVQKEDDENTWYYYKADNPHTFHPGLGDLVTILINP